MDGHINWFYFFQIQLKLYPSRRFGLFYVTVFQCQCKIHIIIYKYIHEINVIHEILKIVFNWGYNLGRNLGEIAFRFLLCSNQGERSVPRFQRGLAICHQYLTLRRGYVPKICDLNWVHRFRSLCLRTLWSRACLETDSNTFPHASHWIK